MALSLPTFDQPLSEKGVTSKVWYAFLSGLYRGIPPAAESAVTVGTSPFIYKAPQKGFAIVQGGTLSMVSYTRNGSTNYNTGATQGCFPLSAGDSLIVTFSVAPTITFVPQ